MVLTFIKSFLFNLFFCLLIYTGFSFIPAEKPDKRVQEIFAAFYKQYQHLQVPEFGFSYQENFRNIPGRKSIAEQQAFFRKYRKELLSINRNSLSKNLRHDYDHLLYELGLNLQRLQLEETYRKNPPAIIPATGLAALPNAKEWYAYYARYYTSSVLSPEQVFEFGEKEVARVQGEIRKIRNAMGYGSDSAGFYRYMQSPEFYLTEKEAVLNQYQAIQEIVRKNVSRLFPETAIPPLVVTVWPEASAFSVPAFYSPAGDNETGSAAFFFNFYNHRHNIRAMDWMFMHEGIPGHHYQNVFRHHERSSPGFRELFYYPANTEGWAAYIENYGKELGLYKTPARELGKWEWDLVRSARVVLDVGIHYKGWTKEEAMQYWKKQVPGQEEIADREVTRCLNWPGQVLSYKVGEKAIKEMLAAQQAAKGADFSLKAFHAAYLRQGMRPVTVMQQALAEDLSSK